MYFQKLSAIFHPVGAKLLSQKTFLGHLSSCSMSPISFLFSRNSPDADTELLKAVSPVSLPFRSPRAFGLRAEGTALPALQAPNVTLAAAVPYFGSSTKLPLTLSVALAGALCAERSPRRGSSPRVPTLRGPALSPCPGGCHLAPARATGRPLLPAWVPQARGSVSSWSLGISLAAEAPQAEGLSDEMEVEFPSCWVLSLNNSNRRGRVSQAHVLAVF